MNVIDQAYGERWALYNGDTVDVARGLPSDSVGLSIFSPPFSSLYTYSDDVRDMGNSRNDEEFWAAYRFLIREQGRVVKPGGICAIHCMDLPTSKARDGYIGLRDFPGDIVRAYQAEGFVYHSRVCIWKDPVTAMQRTKALGLLHKQIRKDSSMSRQGIPDTLIVMRRPGDRVPPVVHHHTIWKAVDPNTGERLKSKAGAKVAVEALTDQEAWGELFEALGSENDMFSAEVDTSPIGMPFGDSRESIDTWQRYASPVWVTTGNESPDGFLDCHPDIDMGDTLNARAAREERDEAHLCPLQLEVIRRCVRLWSHPSDTVWSPFAGIGSEGYIAVQEGRRFVGAELKSSYYQQAVANLRTASAPPPQLSMFPEVT